MVANATIIVYAVLKVNIARTEINVYATTPIKTHATIHAVLKVNIVMGIVVSVTTPINNHAMDNVVNRMSSVITMEDVNQIVQAIVNATTMFAVLKANIVKMVTNVNVTIPINYLATELAVNKMNIVTTTNVNIT